jgi:hypothetical protein
MTCDHRFVPPLFRIAVPGDLNSRVSQIRSWQGALSHHAFILHDSIEMNAKYQVGTSLVRSSGPISSDQVILRLQVHRRPKVLCWGGWFIF